MAIGIANIARSKNAGQMCWQAIVAGAIQILTSSFSTTRRKIDVTASVMRVGNEVTDETKKRNRSYRGLDLRDCVDADCISLSSSKRGGAARGSVRRRFRAGICQRRQTKVAAFAV